MEQALGGVNVLDFSDGMAGGLAASICADFGAEVIKVEKPGGNSCRKMEPFVDGVSLVDSRVNRGKKSIVLDMQRAEDVKTAADLAKKTDVLIEDFSPGRMEALGLGYTSLAVKNPGLIYCSVTPYGQKGPDAHKPANELMVQALAGVMGTTGETGKTPQAHGFAMGDFAAGQTAYGSIVAALCYRLAEGKGQSIDVSIVRSLLFFNSAVERMSLGAYAGLEGNHHPTISPFGIFNGNKGQSVVICALNAKLWNALCTLMERPELAEDPRFVTVGQRAKNPAGKGRSAGFAHLFHQRRIERSSCPVHGLVVRRPNAGGVFP